MHDFFNLIFHNPQASFDPLNFVGVIATVFISLYIFRSETSVSLVKERFEKLICPLFHTIEPIIYQQNSPEVLNHVLKIIEDNHIYCDGKLMNLAYLYRINSSFENFINLCKYIDKTYDKYCRKIGLKTRPMSYRFIKKQYRSKLYLILYFGISLCVHLIAFCGMIITVMGLYSLFSGLFQSLEESAQTIILILMLVCLPAFYNFLEKLL